MYPKEKWSCEAGGYEDRFHWMKRIKLCSATIIVVPALWYLHHFFTHGGFVSEDSIKEPNQRYLDVLHPFRFEPESGSGRWWNYQVPDEHIMGLSKCGS